MSVAGLNHSFGIAGALVFEEREEGLIQARLASAGGRATICLQGGHVTEWQCQGQAEPVLWLSEDARFLPGKSIRGGIPVCWPWFGPYGVDLPPMQNAPQPGVAAVGEPRAGAANAADAAADAPPDYPAHGFARTTLWQVSDSGVDADGTVWLALTLNAAVMPAAMWPHACSLALKVSLASTLQLSLSTGNTGEQPFVFGEALHTYFKISDIESVRVSGLNGCEYWDTVGGIEKKMQHGDIAFDQETDRVYINSPAHCVIEDAGLRRRIHIDTQGSQSTVVWNPWTAKAARMGDLGQPEGWRGMLCVESANAWDKRITLAAGATHTLAVSYRVEAL